MLKSGLTIARRLRSNGLNGVIGAEDVCSRFGKLHYTTAVGQSAINDDPKGKDASSSVPQFGPPEVSAQRSKTLLTAADRALLRFFTLSATIGIRFNIAVAPLQSIL